MKDGNQGMKNTQGKHVESIHSSPKNKSEMMDDDSDDSSDNTQGRGRALDINDKKSDSNQNSRVAEKQDNSKSKF